MQAVSLTACSAAAAAGCGGHAAPRLAHADAAPLTSLARAIATEGSCGQHRDIPRLRRRAIATVNARRVPAALQEPLMSGVAALGQLRPRCTNAGPEPTVAPVLASGGGVVPVPHARSAAQEARNLAAWLERYSG